MNINIEEIMIAVISDTFYQVDAVKKNPVATIQYDTDGDKLLFD